MAFGCARPFSHRTRRHTGHDSRSSAHLVLLQQYSKLLEPMCQGECHQRDSWRRTRCADHKRRLEGLCQRAGASIANDVGTEVQFGDGDVGLVLKQPWRINSQPALGAPLTTHLATQLFMTSHSVHCLAILCESLQHISHTTRITCTLASSVTAKQLEKLLTEHNVTSSAGRVCGKTNLVTCGDTTLLQRPLLPTNLDAIHRSSVTEVIAFSRRLCLVHCTWKPTFLNILKR